ncbi:MAG: MlaD family protein [Candidatus Omnitrophica bacterium]|nr:MlaD family protein [Candidatus Omnitrophota bacterium]MDD5430219.1 MlaD family protein [Candidatus Omnitrophota bacterium]
MAKNLWDLKKSLIYVKVGSFFLAALFLLFITLISVKEINIFKRTYMVKVRFDFAEGLASASPVRFCGVDVGQVKTVKVEAEGSTPRVCVYAKIKQDVKIPKKSYFFINSLSLFGEKYLEIDPPDVITGYIKEGDTIEGVSPVPLFDIFAGFSSTIKEVREFVKDGEIKKSIENILSNMDAITLDVKGLLADIKNEKGTVGKLLYDDSLYESTEEFIVDIKEHPWKLLHKPKNAK